MDDGLTVCYIEIEIVSHNFSMGTEINKRIDLLNECIINHIRP